MKKNQRPIKGQKQTIKPKEKIVINPYIKIEIPTDVLTERFNQYLKENKKRQAYNIGLDLLPKIEQEVGFIHIDTALLYHQMGNLADNLNEYEAMSRHYEKLFKILDEIPADERFKLSELYYITSMAFKRMKKYDKGIEYLLKAIHLFETKQENNDTVFSNLYTKLSDLYLMKHDNENTTLYLRKALDIKEKNRTKIEKEILKYKEEIEENKNKINENEDEKRKIEDKIRENEDKIKEYQDGMIEHYQALGISFSNLNKKEETLAAFNSVLFLLENDKNSNIIEIGEAHCNIAYCYYLNEQYFEALDTYKKALLIFKDNSIKGDKLVRQTVIKYYRCCFYIKEHYGEAAEKSYLEFIQTLYPTIEPNHFTIF